ncbi:MAG: GGDEF domain-containing protein [Pseudolabrys sp.]
MSLQGPMIVVAETPAPDVVQALSTAGAFPIVETNWADAPTAFVAVKPAAVVIAEPGPPPSEANARLLCLQIATAAGPVVPTIARVTSAQDIAIPIALPNDASLPIEHLVIRLRSALRVRALHDTVLRRIEMFSSHGGKMPELPVGDALDDANVMIVGRGPLYPALSVAIGERFGMLGALSVETAARNLSAREVNGIVIGDGFSQRMIEAFLTVLAHDPQYRDIPVAVLGDVPPDFTEWLPNVDHVERDPKRVVARMVPLVRLHAFEGRLKRMLKALDAEGMFDPATGLLTRDSFWRDLTKVVSDAAERGNALSVARFSFDNPIDRRPGMDGARQVVRLMRNIDFGCREEDGSFVVAFTQTALREAHVVSRRIAGALKNTVAPGAENGKASANVTLATLKANDTLDTLMVRVMGSRVVAAE